jgi:hypothetical protein
VKDTRGRMGEEEVGRGPPMRGQATQTPPMELACVQGGGREGA